MEETESTGYLSPAELLAAQELHKRAPYAITGISQGMFSIARHYGRMTFQGCAYTYFSEHDECVRDDVLKLVRRLRKTAAIGSKADAREALPQPGLWKDLLP
jgi:hypothetical protein